MKKIYSLVIATLAMLSVGTQTSYAESPFSLAKGSNANPVAYVQEVNEAETPVYPEAGTYYIKNVATGKYFAAGSSWGSHAIVNDHGFDVKLATMEEGKYLSLIHI